MSSWQDLKNNQRLKQIYETRIAIVRAIRDFFWSRDFLETETPLAVRYPGQEPYLNPVPVTIHDTHSTIHPMFLYTSPEYSMKKLLASGFGKIFQITKTFRDYESFGGLHNPEFTMIEWYRAPGSLAEIMDDVEALFEFVAKKVETKINVGQDWDRMSMKEVWQKYAGRNLDTFLPEGEAYEDAFFKIFLNEIEPKLGLERPLFVYDYPAQMCSLSKLTADPRYAERAELYINGLELANGFGELTDAAEQKKRLEIDRALRQKLGKPTWPVDPDFIAALAGLPAEALAQAGIALGIDRMVLLFTGAKDLNEVMFQSVKDQLE